MMGKLKHKMMAYMYNRMIACDEATYMISYKQDHGLGLWDSMKLRMHLMSCHLCRKYASQIRQMDHMLSRYCANYGSGESGHHLHPDQAARMKSALEDGLNAN